MKVLVIHDVEKSCDRGKLLWAYARRSQALVDHAPPDMVVDRASHEDIRKLDKTILQYDLILSLCYMWAPRYKAILDAWGWKGVYVVSFNKDSRSRHKHWLRTRACAGWIIVNNENRFFHDGPYAQSCCIPNGVDLDVWYPRLEMKNRPIRFLWTGGDGPSKQKRYREVLVPLAEKLNAEGWEHSFRVVQDITPEQVLTTAEQLEWYNNGSVYVSASETEGGGPNTVMEAMSCGCVPVTTWVGGVPEYCIDKVNSVRCDGDAPEFLEACKYAVEHRERLGKAAREAMLRYSYGPPGHVAELFYDLFRQLIRKGLGGVKPYSYKEKWTWH